MWLSENQREFHDSYRLCIQCSKTDFADEWIRAENTTGIEREKICDLYACVINIRPGKITVRSLSVIVWAWWIGFEQRLMPTAADFRMPAVSNLKRGRCVLRRQSLNERKLVSNHFQPNNTDKSKLKTQVEQPHLTPCLCFHVCFKSLLLTSDAENTMGKPFY